LLFLFFENVPFLNDFLFGLTHDLLFPTLFIAVASFLLADEKYSLPETVEVFVDFFDLFKHFRTDLELALVAALAFKVKFLLEYDGHFDFGKCLFFLHDLIHFLLDFFLLIIKSGDFFP
jgi:hypothetical protein